MTFALNLERIHSGQCPINGSYANLHLFDRRGFYKLPIKGSRVCIETGPLKARQAGVAEIGPED